MIYPIEVSFLDNPIIGYSFNFENAQNLLNKMDKNEE